MSNTNITSLTEFAKTSEKLHKYNEAIDYYLQIILIENNIINKCIIFNQIGMCYTFIHKYYDAIEYFNKII